MSSPKLLSNEWWAFAKRHEFILCLAILAVVVLTTILDVQHNYWRNPRQSFEQIIRHTSMLGIFSLGAAIVIIAGGIDLSSGSVIAFSGTICGTILVILAPEQMAGTDPIGIGYLAIAVVGTLLSGALIGSLHAWLITVVGLPPFVATLATLVGLRSLARAICEAVTAAYLNSQSTQIQINDRFFRQLATVYWVPALLFAVLAFLSWLMLSRTVVGRHIYALGGNEEAARLSGIRTNRLKWLAYCLSAMLSSLAGILYICDQSVAAPQTLGMGYELNGIAAAVVGGCSLQGGVGTVPGTILGALFLRIIIDAVPKVIKSGADVYQGLIVGVVVVFAVAFSQMGQAKGRRPSFFSGALGIVAIMILALLAGTIAALIGPQLLAGQIELDSKFLASIAGIAVLLWLVVIRADLSRRVRGILGIVLACLVVATTIGLDHAVPVYRQRKALAVIEQVGGVVSPIENGRRVELSDSSFANSDLKQLAVYLSHIPDLKELSLSGTAINDDGLEYLGVVTQIESVDLRQTDVTRGGVRRLGRILPDATIEQ